jgi:hypothetical protein|tara:strand:+ start:228 stop:425 length:198 start_codon:yes stop_codon:yes gene_type:complete
MRNYHQRLTELIRIQEERNLILKELQDTLGFDISFSEDDVLNNAIDVLSAELVKDIEKDMSVWMK